MFSVIWLPLIIVMHYCKHNKGTPEVNRKPHITEKSLKTPPFHPPPPLEQALLEIETPITTLQLL